MLFKKGSTLKGKNLLPKFFLFSVNLFLGKLEMNWLQESKQEVTKVVCLAKSGR